MNSLFKSRVPGASPGASTTTVTYACQGQPSWEGRRAHQQHFVAGKEPSRHARHAMDLRLTPSERGQARRPTGKTVRTDRGRDSHRHAETRPPTQPTIALHCRGQGVRYRGAAFIAALR